MLGFQQFFTLSAILLSLIQAPFHFLQRKPAVKHDRVTLNIIRRTYAQKTSQQAPLLGLVGERDIIKLFEQFCRTQFELLDNETSWTNKDKWQPELTQFIQKIDVTTNARLAVVGDLHGDIDSFLAIVQDWQTQGVIDREYHITKPTDYLVFLGDLADRGPDTIAVWYVAQQLKVANPNRVFILRGNHEIANLNKDAHLPEQIELNYHSITLCTYLYAMYNYLPSALFVQFLGSDNRYHCALCCHGGIEWGINPYPLLSTSAHYQNITMLNRDAAPGWLKKQIDLEEWDCSWFNINPNSTHFGLLWGDFDDTSDRISYEIGRGLKANRRLTQEWLDSISTPEHRVEKIIRGHQHSDFYDKLVQHGGVYSMWKNLVTTVISCLPILANLQDRPPAAYLWLTPAPDGHSWQTTPIAIPL